MLKDRSIATDAVSASGGGSNTWVVSFTRTQASNDPIVGILIMPMT